MSEPSVVTETRGAITVLRINRPDRRNAFDLDVMAGLGNGLESADSDPAVRAVVLTGTGDKAFCAGMDLRAFAGGELEVSAGQDAGIATFNRFLHGETQTPVVCAANGSALAGGFELLLACDLVVAADHATFGLPEVKRGLFAAGGGVFVSQRLPLAIALELALTGDAIDAGRAAAFGLVNKVVPAADVVDEAVSLAEAIAANGPLGVQATRELVRAAVTTSTDQVWARQAEIQPGVFASEDAIEGATAFVERRAPVWKGR